MGKDKTKYGVSYGLIDGNFTQGNNLYGYCKAHQGLLSYPLAKVHRCRNREEGGLPCRHFICFERIDNRYKSELKGEEFRASLGKKGKNRGARKKYQEPDSVPETTEISETEQADNSVGSVEQVRDIQTVGTDLRPETARDWNRVKQDYCSQCFWRKMYGRVVQANFSARRDE